MSRALVSVLDAKLDLLIPASLRRDPDVFRQAKRVGVFDFAFLFWAVVFAATYAALGSARCALVTLWAVFPIFGSLVALERGRSPALCGNLLCSAGYIALTALGLLTGGWTAIPPMLWYAVLPVVAVLTSGVLWGFVWTVIPLATIAAFALLHVFGVTLPQELDPPRLSVFGYAIVVGLVLCQFVLAWVRVGVEQRALAALHETRKNLAKARAEMELLKNGFGFSLDDWAKLQREKTALEYFIKRRFGNLDINDERDFDPAELEDAALDADEPEIADLDKAKTADG